MTGIEDDLALALELADAADALTMAAFTGSPLPFTAKADGSPVTETDRAVEEALVALLHERRPGDGVVGEETGVHGSGPRRWIIDPIDGTVSFTAGGTGWGTQLALEVDGRIVLGLTSAPSVPGRWWGAAGVGAWNTRGAHGEPRAMRVSDRGADDLRWTCAPGPDDLRDPSLAERLRGLGTSVESRSHGAFDVATGRIEACLLADGAPWDHAGFAGLVEGAGGRFTYLDGTTDLRPSAPALVTNGLVHDAVLARLAPSP